MTGDGQCPWQCRQRNILLRRNFAGYPGDHITPEIFDRLEAMTPRRIDFYTRGRFSLVLNAVLQAGLDAIEAGQAAPEYTVRGVTVVLKRPAGPPASAPSSPGGNGHLPACRQ